VRGSAIILARYKDKALRNERLTPRTLSRGTCCSYLQGQRQR
jgi:hypothetical protein